MVTPEVWHVELILEDTGVDWVLRRSTGALFEEVDTGVAHIPSDALHQASRAMTAFMPDELR